MSDTFKSEVTSIWAGRGGGKTTLAKKIISDANPKRVVFIDPMSAAGYPTIPLYIAALKTDNRYIVFNGQRREDQVAAIYAAYIASTTKTPIYCVCDEAPAYLDKTTDGLNSIMFKGRHRAFGMMILGQRPNAVNAQIRSQTAVTFWGKITDHVDRSIAQQSIGPERARQLSEFKPGEFIQHPPKGS